MPWPLSKVVMGPTWAFCSLEAVGVIICQGARVDVCVWAAVFLGHMGLGLVSEHTVLYPDALAPNRMKCIFTQPCILLYVCFMYM